MKKYLKQIKANKKGFTLIEMIVVIAIIGILAAILVPSMAGYLSTARDSRKEANAKTVYTAAQAAVTSLEATEPVAGTGSTGAVYKKTLADNDNATRRKDLFDKIKELIGASNYGNFFDIEVTVSDGAVIKVLVKEDANDTKGTTYPK